MNTSIPMTISDDRFMIFMLSYGNTIGSETIKKIDRHFDLLSDVLLLTDNELRLKLQLKESQVTEINLLKRKLSVIQKEYEILMNSSIKYVTFKDMDYPERLIHIPQSPAALYYYGELPDIHTPTVSIVGSRAATGYGSSASKYFARVLADNGINIISGMAVGIDAAAHIGALSSKEGKTHAVLAGGVNVIYPRENKSIYDEILNGHRGSIVSEMMPGKPAIRRNFPLRNRIISGLSDIVLVVEAREKSGSLITVDYAKRQNIPVMAVPGRITDPLSKGTNRLIFEGASIALSPEAVLKSLNINDDKSEHKTKETLNMLDKDEKIVYSTLDLDPKHIEIIMNETSMSNERVMEALISLELKGRIRQVSSNYYICNQR